MILILEKGGRLYILLGDGVNDEVYMQMPNRGGILDHFNSRASDPFWIRDEPFARSHVRPATLRNVQTCLGSFTESLTSQEMVGDQTPEESLGKGEEGQSSTGSRWLGWVSDQSSVAYNPPLAEIPSNHTAAFIVQPTCLKR